MKKELINFDHKKLHSHSHTSSTCKLPHKKWSLSQNSTTATTFIDNDNDDVPPIPEPVDVLANICDGVVAERTLASYINDALAFVKWCISLGNKDLFDGFWKGSSCCHA